ncbi:hypothetical protein [Aeoliella mucimassa]|nr:hypothetical protein [Aeoliella mucimassa]
MPEADSKNPISPLGIEEYIEQGHFFRTLGTRVAENIPAQDVLAAVREETLATCKLPMAIDFMLAELRHAGTFATAMAKLPHYFTPFQTYVIDQAENERGRFDLRVGLAVLAQEAEYRAGRYHETAPTLQGLFLYQFEVLCRNRLGYDQGLTAISGDPAYSALWREWILTIRHQVGMVDIADLLYVRSDYYHQRANQSGHGDTEPSEKSAPLFGEREGRIALANRRKDPLFLFASLHRQLGYPEVPRPVLRDPKEDLLPQMARRLEQLEKRMKLMEEEQRGGIDLTKLYEPPPEYPSR